MQNPKSLLQHVVTRWRLRRFESKHRRNEMGNRNSAEHLDRLAEGIKDVPAGGGAI